MYLDRLKTVVEQLNQLEKVSIKNGFCTPEEVSYFERKLGFKFPKAYEEYLLWDGRNQGIFFGDFASADDIDYNREKVDEMLKESNISEKVVPEDALIFYVNHGAYSFAFICVSEGDDPPIHYFRKPNIGIQWNYSRNIEEFCLKRITDQYGNLVAKAISSLDPGQPENFS